MNPSLAMKTLFFILLLIPGLRLSAQQTVHVISINGSINPASARFIEQSCERAADQRASALIVELNTPGGLLQSTREIVSALFHARIPVAVYVYPQGGQAASAGAFIAMAAHIAAMAPGTNIGAAHPVTQGEGNTADSSNIPMTKATNDAAAFARSIAEKRGRNVAWAEQSVINSVSATASEALSLGIIDFISAGESQLLIQMDSVKCSTPGGMRLLLTKNARIVRYSMPFQLELLNLLSDPNIAYVLLMLGIYGLFFELYNPGSIFPGVTGSICLILGLYSLNTLPINYAGFALIIIGAILFLLEIKIISHGLLSIGGVISIFLGSIMLIDTPEGVEFMSISLSVIVAATVVSAGFFMFIAAKGLKAMKRRPATGAEGMVGTIGAAVEPLNPEGRIFVHGEYWNAHLVSGSAGTGTTVRIVRTANLTAYVEIVKPNE